MPLALPYSHRRSQPPLIARNVPMETGTASVAGDSQSLGSVKVMRLQFPKQRGIIRPTRTCSVSFIERLTTFYEVKMSAVAREHMEG